MSRSKRMRRDEMRLLRLCLLERGKRRSQDGLRDSYGEWKVEMTRRVQRAPTIMSRYTKRTRGNRSKLAGSQMTWLRGQMAYESTTRDGHVQQIDRLSVIRCQSRCVWSTNNNGHSSCDLIKVDHEPLEKVRSRETAT